MRSRVKLYGSSCLKLMIEYSVTGIRKLCSPMKCMLRRSISLVESERLVSNLEPWQKSAKRFSAGIMRTQLELRLGATRQWAMMAEAYLCQRFVPIWCATLRRRRSRPGGLHLAGLQQAVLNRWCEGARLADRAELGGSVRVRHGCA